MNTLKEQAERIARRWVSGHTNARLEVLKGLFQAARARAREYRDHKTFITMIYLLAAPIGNLLDPAKA